MLWSDSARGRGSRHTLRGPRPCGSPTSENISSCGAPAVHGVVSALRSCHITPRCAKGCRSRKRRMLWTWSTWSLTSLQVSNKSPACLVQGSSHQGWVHGQCADVHACYAGQRVVSWLLPTLTTWQTEGLDVGHFHGGSAPCPRWRPSGCPGCCRPPPQPHSTCPCLAVMAAWLAKSWWSRFGIPFWQARVGTSRLRQPGGISLWGCVWNVDGYSFDNVVLAA